MRSLIQKDAQSEQLPNAHHARTDASHEGSHAGQTESLENTNIPLKLILPTFPLPTVPLTVTTTPGLRTFIPLGPALPTNISNGSAPSFTASMWLTFCALFLAGAIYRRWWLDDYRRWRGFCFFDLGYKNQYWGNSWITIATFWNKHGYFQVKIQHEVNKTIFQ